MNIDLLLSDQPLHALICEAYVADAHAGGQVLFTGTVRKQTRGKSVLRLEFEAYEPMALAEMRKIAAAATTKYGLIKISIHHRIGILEVGDIAVLIAVSAPHRKAAFEACAYAIDTLKETVPIWKKEIFEDGEEWVAAHP